MLGTVQPGDDHVARLAEDAGAPRERLAGLPRVAGDEAALRDPVEQRPAARARVAEVVANDHVVGVPLRRQPEQERGAHGAQAVCGPHLVQLLQHDRPRAQGRPRRHGRPERAHAHQHHQPHHEGRGYRCHGVLVLPRGDEDAEGVSGRVGENVKRLS